MILSKALYERSIVGRKRILQSFLKEHGSGEITDEEDSILKSLFEDYYTPDPGQTKYSLDEIQRFYIGSGAYNTLCFHIRLKDGSDDVATLRRLSGENRTQVANLNRALRYAIEDQIQEFRFENPLDPLALCPISGKNLGSTAEVDHFGQTFSEIVRSWLQENTDPKFIPGPKGSSLYFLEEPYLRSWREHHKKYARLRWLSKEGNAIAHRI